MATASTAAWRMRTGGNAANGAGYDGATYPGGSDLTQQDAAQASWTASLTLASGTLTDTGAGGLFTAAMVGNAVKVASQGYYWISARTDGNNVTVVNATGTAATSFSGATGKVGGGVPGDPLAIFGPLVVPGNTVYLRATAGNYASWPTTSLDYAISAFVTPTAGSAAVGWINWVAENGVPTIGVPGLAWYNVSFQRLSGLYLVATNNTTGTFGVINGAGAIAVDGCYLNLNNKASLIGIAMQGGEVRNSTITGKPAGTATASSGGHLISTSSTAVASVINNNLYNGADAGINEGGGGLDARFNRIWGCNGNGIVTSSTSTATNTLIEYNTIDANLGHGISVTGTAGAAAMAIRNNSISNHTGSGKYGVSFSDGSTATNNARVRYFSYNNLYNNTANYNNISAGANDLNINPSYASASTGDFTPSNAAMQAALP